MTAPVELPVSSPSWFARAECFRRGADLNLFYPDNARHAPEVIEAFCEHCPVMQHCHDYAEKRGESGIWGGRLRIQRGMAGPIRTYTRADLEGGKGRPGQIRRTADTPECSVCGQATRVREDGTIGSHFVGRGDKRRHCDGSRRAPVIARAAS